VCSLCASHSALGVFLRSAASRGASAPSGVNENATSLRRVAAPVGRCGRRPPARPLCRRVRRPHHVVAAVVVCSCRPRSGRGRPLTPGGWKPGRWVVAGPGEGSGRPAWPAVRPAGGCSSPREPRDLTAGRTDRGQPVLRGRSALSGRARGAGSAQQPACLRTQGSGQGTGLSGAGHRSGTRMPGSAGRRRPGRRRACGGPAWRGAFALPGRPVGRRARARGRGRRAAPAARTCGGPEGKGAVRVAFDGTPGPGGRRGAGRPRGASDATGPRPGSAVPKQVSDPRTAGNSPGTHGRGHPAGRAVPCSGTLTTGHRPVWADGTSAARRASAVA
jgi:hypothetical protein